MPELTGNYYQDTYGMPSVDDVMQPLTEEPEQPQPSGNYYQDKYGMPEIELPAPKELPKSEYGMGVWLAFKRGGEMLAALPDLAQGDYEELAGHFQRMEELGRSDEDLQKLRAIQETEGWWDTTVEIFKEPRLVAQVVAESLPNMLAPATGGIIGGLGGGAAGTAIAGPPGAAIGAVGGTMTGAALGSFATEYLHGLSNFLTEEGVDMTNADELKAAFANDELMLRAKEKARLGGLPVAVFDGLSFGLAGRIYKPGSAIVKMATGGGEVGMQAGFGMAGEAGKQLLTEGEITSKADVLYEGIAEIPGAIVEPIVRKIVESSKQADDDGLSAQLREGVTDEELDQMSAEELREKDALSLQIRTPQLAIEATFADIKAEQDVALAELDVAVREDEQRSEAFLQMEGIRDQRLTAMREAVERERGFAEIEGAREIELGEAREEIERGRLEGVVEPTGTQVATREELTEEQLHAVGAQPAEGEIVAGEPVPTAGRPGTSLGEAITEAQERQAAQEKEAGREVKAKPLKPPEKPSVSRPTKAINLDRDSFLVTRAKSPVSRRLSQKAFAEEGLDIESMREKVYGGKPAFSKHPDAMTPDDVAEFLNEQGYPRPQGRAWDANSALDAITEEVEGRDKLFTGADMETAKAEEAFSEAYSEYEYAVAEREQKGVPKTFEITVDGVDALIEEDPDSKSVEVTIGEDTIITDRKKGESNADLVRTVLKAQKQEKMMRPAVGKVKRAPIKSDIVEAEETIPTPNEARARRQKEIERQAVKDEAILEREAIQAESKEFEELEAEAQEAATSPENELPQPSEAQKEAGNYKKGHITFKGLMIAIENPVGSVRFRNMKMKDHYGYINRTEGVDGDQVDVFVNPELQEDLDTNVYVIDQTKEDGVTFDEHKVMLGYLNQLDAVRAYKRNYEKGWKVGPVTEMSMPEFKTWLEGPTKAPVQGAPSRQNRKFIRDQKGRLKFSLQKANKAMLDDAKVAIPGANVPFLKAVLGDEYVDVDAVPELDTEAIAERAVADSEKALREGVDVAVNRINKVFPGAKIRMLESIEDAPKDIQEAAKFRGQSPRGLYANNTDEIFLFRNKIDSADVTVELALHEMFHKGGRIAFGEKFGVLLDDLAKNISGKYHMQYHQIKEKYDLTSNTKADNRAAAEEFIAEIAETNPKANVLKRFVAAVRRMLRQAGLVQEWTDNDIISMIAEAHGALRRIRGRPIGEVSLTEEVQLEETGEIFDIETNAEVVLRQHDKRTGVIEKLRACL